MRVGHRGVFSPQTFLGECGGLWGSYLLLGKLLVPLLPILGNDECVLLVDFQMEHGLAVGALPMPGIEAEGH